MNVSSPVGPTLHKLARHLPAAVLVTVAVGGTTPARAAWFEVCRGLNVGVSLGPLVVPQGSLFRDDGRADDPLADYTGDKLRLRVETLARVDIPQIGSCARVLVRITADSAVRSVAAGDGRRFVYAGSANLLDENLPSEDLLTARGRVLDSVP